MERLGWVGQAREVHSNYSREIGSGILGSGEGVPAILVQKSRLECTAVPVTASGVWRRVSRIRQQRDKRVLSSC